jgi:hypothetical protein
MITWRKDLLKLHNVADGTYRFLKAFPSWLEEANLEDEAQLCFLKGIDTSECLKSQWP